MAGYLLDRPCILLHEKGHLQNAIYYIIPTIWHSGEGIATKRVKRFVAAKAQESMRKGQTGERESPFKTNYSAWHYNDGYVTCISHNPQNYTTQRVNLKQTMEFN